MQTGLLPYLTENVDDLGEVLRYKKKWNWSRGSHSPWEYSKFLFFVFGSPFSNPLKPVKISKKKTQKPQTSSQYLKVLENWDCGTLLQCLDIREVMKSMRFTLWLRRFRPQVQWKHCLSRWWIILFIEEIQTETENEKKRSYLNMELFLFTLTDIFDFGKFFCQISFCLIRLFFGLLKPWYWAAFTIRRVKLASATCIEGEKRLYTVP